MNLKELRKLPKNKLQAEYNATKQQIEICFGCKDLMWLDALENEIDRRGYQVMADYKFY